MTYDDITVGIEGAIATICVNRPEKLNALRDQTADELVAALQSLEQIPEVTVVILTGSGRAFGTGYDLGTVNLDEGCDLHAVLEHHFNPLILALRRSRLLIISRVNGPCAGVSVGIALSCDIVMASQTAYFYEPFAQIALVPDGGNTYFLPTIAGRTRALAAMLLGDKISAEEAMAWGLVWQVHAADMLDAKVQETATRIARLAPNAIKRTKQLVNTACESGLAAQLDLERDYQGELGGSPEMVAAISRFVKGGKGHQ
ncbi:MAG: enoyl-CoA hydratase-related protein [Alphaproteobacteria bacterium]|nr:enoyl-CoA hydratase-related protein [Alphaproteobacteria bacterium]